LINSVPQKGTEKQVSATVS